MTPPRPVYASIGDLLAVVGTVLTLSDGSLHVHLTHVPASGVLTVGPPDDVTEPSDSV